VLAYVYPLLGVFWTMLWFFCFVIFIWLLITVFADLFRSHDIGGWAKAGWTILIIFLPFLGILIYLIARGKGMAERNVKQAADQKAAFDEYVRETAASASPADQLETLAKLHDEGKLSDEDFEKAKAKILA